jgi:purine-binding chemotaxis protein CheW
MAQTRQFASFDLTELLFGIEVERVQEVTTGNEITRVPLAPPVVHGVLNLRGRIVTAIDLRRCLQLAERSADQRPVNLILQTDDGCASLLVDHVGNVLDVDDSDFEPPPATLRGRVRDLIRGAYKLDSRLLLVLDADKVLEGVGGLVCGSR